jgi:error-prone DNA polymerase
MSGYVELQATSHFSFLRGVSSCDELFAAAALLGYRALGIADRNSVAGLVRATIAADATGMRLVAGCRLDLQDGASLLVWPEDRSGWSRLTRLLTLGKSRADAQHGEKGQCFLHWEDVAGFADGLVGALVPDKPDEVTAANLGRVRDIFGRRAFLALSHRRRPGRFDAAPRPRPDGACARGSERRGRRRPLPFARPANAPGRGDGDPQQVHDRRARLPPRAPRRPPL